MSRPSSHTPLDSSLEFLSRSWRVSPSTHFVNSKIPAANHGGLNWGDIVLEDSGGDAEGFLVFMNPFSFTSSETSQMVMDRILSHSQDVSPRTSGRLSHSSGPLNAAHGGGSFTDSPPFSPSEIADLDSKDFRFTKINGGAAVKQSFPATTIQSNFIQFPTKPTMAIGNLNSCSIRQLPISPKFL